MKIKLKNINDNLTFIDQLSEKQLIKKKYFKTEYEIISIHPKLTNHDDILMKIFLGIDLNDSDEQNIIIKLAKFKISLLENG